MCTVKKRVYKKTGVVTTITDLSINRDKLYPKYPWNSYKHKLIKARKEGRLFGIAKHFNFTVRGVYNG